MGVRDRHIRSTNAEQRSVIDGFLHCTRLFEPELWTALFVVMVLDVVLTMYGLHLGLAEGNPIARVAIDQFGVLGLVLLKAFSIGIAVLGWARVERRFRALVPLGVSIVWGFAVAVNATLIVAVIA
ncbi:MAG TPA: DUF5658 family protein [Natrialbaceae archaeon]|nr:DUF5658 family protein [Natrialbaceae archaeon]